MREVVFSDKAPAAIGPYSQAIKSGNAIYFSGQIGMNPANGELVSKDVREQTKQALKNLQAVIVASGASITDVCKVNVFLNDMSDFGVVNEIYSEVFKTDPPARSCMAVAGLPKGALVEIEAIAVVGD